MMEMFHSLRSFLFWKHTHTSMVATSYYTSVEHLKCDLVMEELNFLFYLILICLNLATCVH